MQALMTPAIQAVLGLGVALGALVVLIHAIERSKNHRTSVRFMTKFWTILGLIGGGAMLIAAVIPTQPTLP